MDADRRRIVQAALATVVWPAVWAGASGSTWWSPLRRVHREAVASGAPLLVLVVPEDPDEREWRGVLLGAVLNHGSARCLAALGACHVVCAEPDDLVRELPQVGAVPSGAWFVWICGPEVRFGTPAVARVGPWCCDDPALPGAVAQVEDALVGTLDAPPAAEVPALADRAREQWVEGAVPGARWMSFRGGCAGEFRPEHPNPARWLRNVAVDVARFPVMCGRAHVSELAARMIAFY